MIKKFRKYMFKKGYLNDTYFPERTKEFDKDWKYGIEVTK